MCEHSSSRSGDASVQVVGTGTGTMVLDAYAGHGNVTPPPWRPPPGKAAAVAILSIAGRLRLAQVGAKCALERK